MALKIKGFRPGHLIVVDNASGLNGEEAARALYVFIYDHISFINVMAPFLKILARDHPSWLRSLLIDIGFTMEEAESDGNPN